MSTPTVAELVANIEELTDQRNKAKDKLAKAKARFTEAEDALRRYGSTMTDAQQAEALLELSKSKAAVKTARETIDKLKAQLAQQEELLALARRIELAEEQARTATQAAQAAAADEAEHAQAVDENPDPDRATAHRQALREAQRRRAQHTKAAAAAAATAAGLAAEAVDLLNDEPGATVGEEPPVPRSPSSYGLAALVAAAAAIWLARR